MICTLLGLISISGLQELLTTSGEMICRNRLLQIITFARETSVMMHRTVTLCHSADLKTCGGSWGDGVLVYAGESIDGGKILLAERLNLRGSLFARFFPRYREEIQFDPMAEVTNDNGTIWYCRPHAPKPTYAITINRVGVAAVQLPDRDGDIRDSHGKALACHQQLLV